jgi:hypothetical protein
MAMIMQPPGIGKARLTRCSVESLAWVLGLLGFLGSRGFVGSLSFWAGLIAPLYTTCVLKGAFTLFYKIYFL